MPLLLTRGKAIFFAHVPKTGGSSVEDYLVRRFGPLSVIDRHKREGRRGTGLITPATHLSALDLEEMIPPNIDLCFALVRDPLRRLLSEYRWQSGSSRASRMPFSAWLRVVLRATRREPRLYENHIRPQAELVPEGAEAFRLEDGFDAMIARLDAVTATTAPEFGMGHLLRRGGPREEIAVTSDDAARVAEYYAVDYDRFGYARPDPAEHAPGGPGRLRPWEAVLAEMLVRKQRRDWVR